MRTHAEAVQKLTGASKGKRSKGVKKREPLPLVTLRHFAHREWVDLPIRTVNESNNRDHWRVRAKRNASNRFASEMLCTKWLQKISDGTVRLTRIGPGVLDDDGVVSALKAVRDGIAEWLGIDDGDPRIRYEYAQEQRRAYGVRVELRP